MMQTKNLALSALALLSASLLFVQCASITGFQDGRTVGEGNGEFLASLNASQSPDFDFEDNDSTGIERFFFPNLEFSGRYGITEKLDVGLRVNTLLNFALDGKIQVVGDRQSPIALSLGAGFGTFGLFSALWNIQVPVYLSFHPADHVSIYFSPRYIAQFAAGDISGSLSYLGGNAGILFGKHTKFGLDIGYYNIGVTEADGADVGIATYGIGIKIPFGDK